MLKPSPDHFHQIANTKAPCTHSPSPSPPPTTMDSALTVASSLTSSILHLKSTPTPPNPSFFPMLKHSSKPLHFHCKRLTIKASSSHSNPSTPNPFISALKTTATSLIFSAVVFGGKFYRLPARADPPPPALTEEMEEITQVQEKNEENSPLTQFLESNSDAIEGLKSLLEQKLSAGEDHESLEILKKLSLVQPENAEWKFLLARLLNEMGNTVEARRVFEEILSKNPLSFEALFENALLMDKCGEGEAVLRRLEEALKIAEEEKKVAEARNVRLIMAQVYFLQKNAEEALRSYDELEREDPSDFRPYFCKGMIYSLLDKNTEAREQFARYRQLSPKKFEVEGYLRSPLSKMKLFGTDEPN